MKDALTARRVGWYLRELCVWMLLADVVSAQPGGVPHEGVLRPRISRDAQALWEAAAQDQQRKQWSTVFPRWEQLLKTHATELIEVEGVVGSVTWHHARRLSSLPAVVRREWERYFLPTLNMVWNEWLQRREESIIRNFLCLAVGTSQEVMGLRHFAARHRELGHWASARIALQRIISHSQATPAEKARAYVGLWELSRLDNLPLPDSGIPEQEASLWQQSVTRGEETRSLREWYTVLLAPDRTPSKRRTMPPGRSLTDIPWQQLRFHDLPEPLLSAWQEWEPLYRQAGAMPLLVHSPLIVGPHLIFRSTKELTAWDISVLEQPREIWRVDLSQEWSWLHTNPGLLENRGFRMLLVEQLYRRFYADSCWGRMTTDGTRIFLVRDTLPLGAGSTGGQASVWPPRPASNRHDSRVNQVLAFDIVLGELSWQAGGHSSGDSYPLVRHYFFGPPTPWDSYVLGIAQADMELRLVALEADSGAWSWSVVLGDLPQLAQDSLLRQRLACPIWFHQGQAICTTSAGALVAVDLLWHHVIWVARYPVATPPLITDERLAHSPLLRDPWWRGWRENTGHLDQQVLWFSPGEADQLLAVDLTTGQTIGQIPRREAQWFLGLVSDQLLMLEPTALRAHHPHTGSLLWREEVGEVVGKPLLVNNQIMLATLPAGWMILDSKNRQRHYIQTLPNIPFFPVHSLLRLMPNSDRDTVQQVGIVATPGEWHVFDIPQPAPQSAQHILSSEHTSSALKLRTALSELSRDPAVLVPLEHALNVQELTVEQQLLWTCGLARAEGRLGQCMQAAKRLLTHESLFHPELYLTLHHPARQVRADLFYLGTWQELIDRASDTERQRLHELFRDHARNLQQQGFDPFAWQRWYLLWHQHKWGETAEWLQEPSVTRGLPWRTLEAWVFSGTDSSQRQLKHAWLAEQYRHAGMLSAAWIHQQLAPPLVKPAASRDQVADPRWTRHWPNKTPEIASLSNVLVETVHHTPVPLDLESRGLFEHLDITLDRQGKRLRFTGWEGQAWELSLPPAHTPWRAAPEFVHAWGRGQVFLLRIGTDLMGIAPLNEQGLPAAKVLWSLPLVTSPQTDYLTLAPPSESRALPPPELLDAFRFPLGRIGPVLAESFCYQQASYLVCRDLLTGTLRWISPGLTDDAMVTGDEQDILVIKPSQGEICHLRAVDGERLACHTRPMPAGRWIRLLGRYLWRETPSPHAHLLCEDLLSGQVVWQRELTPGSRLVPLDNEVCGWLSAEGQLQIVDWLTGADRTEPVPLPAPSGVEQVHVSRDAVNWYLALDTRDPGIAPLRWNQIRQAYRTPVLTGMLCAVDRHEHRLQWSAVLQREGWPIDQPRHLPILIQIYRASSPDFMQTVVHPPTVLKIRDKRSGRELLTRDDLRSIPYVSLVSDVQRGIIHVYLEREAFQLHYRPMPPPPPLPEPTP